MKRLLFVTLLIALVVTSAPFALAGEPEQYFVTDSYILYGRTSGKLKDLRGDDDKLWSITEKRYGKTRGENRVPAYDAFDARLIFEERSCGNNLVLYIEAWHENDWDPDDIMVQWRYQFGPVVEGTLPLEIGTEPGTVYRVELPCIPNDFQIMFADTYRGPLYKDGLDLLHIDQIYLQREGDPYCEAAEELCDL